MKINSTKNIHLIGIGGIGMSAIARILLDMNYNLSGSDQKNNDIIEKLIKKGVDIKIGHTQKNLPKATDIVVTSTAISPVNPEVLAANEKNIPILHRGDILADIMRLKKGIAVTGTHGKTTTTGLIASIFNEAKLSPTIIIGGKWGHKNINAVSGKSEYLICEADESDGSFLKLSPVYSVITNIDNDHMDFYKSEENLIDQFLNFINHTPFYGKSFICLENIILNKIQSQIKIPYASYGFHPSHSIYAYEISFKDLKSSFKVVAYGKNLGKFELNLNGKHNILNSLAAIAMGLEVKISLPIIKSALKKFPGIKRRMTCLGKWKKLTIIDDYAHHPTEIEATLTALKPSKQKIIAAFQPHRYSRTLSLYKEIAQSLLVADTILLCEIYPAGEKPIDGVTSKLIYDEVKKTSPKKEIFLFKDINDLKEKFDLPVEKDSSDLIKILNTTKAYLLFMGAGNINQVGMDITA